MEYIQINNKTYNFTYDFKDNDKIRKSFNELTQKTYGFDFENWYQNGYWQDKYIPHILLDENKVIANISVNPIEFYVMGEKRTFVQIGTVMTDENYRKQGLNRILMEKAIELWKNKCDLMYLFANDSVLNYYPKFGFIKANEYQYSKNISTSNKTSDIVKLNMSDNNDKELLYNTITNSKPSGQLCMTNNPSLIMFYCTSFMTENVYYIKKLNTIVIANFDNDTLLIYDVFCTKNVELDTIITSIINKDIKKLVLGFTPIDTSNYDVNLLQEENTTLFVMKNQLDIFDKEKLMFPLLSHA